MAVAGEKEPTTRPPQPAPAAVTAAMPATMKDVARLAGVSTATVSRALMKPEMVSEETRTQVLEAVAAAGYTPNVLDRNLRKLETRRSEEHTSELQSLLRI